MIRKLFIILVLTLALAACTKDSRHGTPVLPPSLELEGRAAPEDIAFYNGFLYTSNFVNASVLRIDLYNPTRVSVFVPPAETRATRSFGWGLCVMPNKNWLLYIVNPFYDFLNFPANSGEVRAYNLTTGIHERTWILPANTIGNAILIDDKDKIYVGDVTSNTRIIKIDPVTDSATVWFEDPVNWPQTPGSWGLGGMVFDQNSNLYVSAKQDKLWCLPINADGTPGVLRAVTLTNSPAGGINADGMSWAGNNTLYYAYDDLFVQGSHGVVYKVELNGPVTGTVSELASSLKDPSGVYAASFRGVNYVFVNESQFGHDLGVDPGDPTFPYRVLVFRR